MIHFVIHYIGGVLVTSQKCGQDRCRIQPALSQEQVNKLRQIHQSYLPCRYMKTENRIALVALQEWQAINSDSGCPITLSQILRVYNQTLRPAESQKADERIHVTYPSTEFWQDLVQGTCPELRLLSKSTIAALIIGWWIELREITNDSPEEIRAKVRAKYPG